MSNLFKNKKEITHSIESANTILLNAPMTTRLKYDYNVKLDSHMSIFHLIKDPNISKIIEKLYRIDIEISQKYNLPIILTIPTYRASKYHLENNGFNAEDVESINLDCCRFVDNIRNTYRVHRDNIFIAGSVGTKYDAYNPTLKLELDESQGYHDKQMQALATAKVDLINIVTMPSLSEALGCALAASKTKIPYTVGFIIDENGNLLDGSPLHLAIDTIDNYVNPSPFCYLLICTHYSKVTKALTKYYSEYDRIKGIRANGSSKSPYDLAKLNHAIADDPIDFANKIIFLKNKYKWKILGGCCGTNSSHLEAIAKRLSNIS